MDAQQATPYDGQALAAQYNCKGQPSKYVFVLGNFETKPCSRCGGGGHYSYCQRYGTVCFGCSGVGFQYTARGKVALDYFKALQTKPLCELAPGTRVYDRDGIKCTLAEVAPTASAPGRSRVGAGPWIETGGVGSGYVDYTLQYSNGSHRYINHHPATPIRVRGWQPSDVQAMLQLAHKLQANLTKQGKRRQRAVR